MVSVGFGRPCASTGALSCFATSTTRDPRRTGWTVDREQWDTRAMAIPIRGTVHGRTVTLEAVVPPLEGRKVFVLLQLDDSGEDNRPQLEAVWEEWLKRGDEGPLEVEGAQDFP